MHVPLEFGSLIYRGNTLKSPSGWTSYREQASIAITYYPRAFVPTHIHPSVRGNSSVNEKSRVHGRRIKMLNRNAPPVAPHPQHDQQQANNTEHNRPRDAQIPEPHWRVARHRNECVTYPVWPSRDSSPGRYSTAAEKTRQKRGINELALRLKPHATMRRCRFSALALRDLQ